MREGISLDGTDSNKQPQTASSTNSPPFPTLTAPSPRRVPWKANASQPPSLQSKTSVGSQRGEENPNKLSKGQPCQPGQPGTQHRSIPGKNLFSHQLKPAMKAFRKTEKRKTEREGKSEGANAECVSHFCFSRELWASKLDGRAGWAPVRPGSVADRP